jgi:hypothetical protein
MKPAPTIASRVPGLSSPPSRAASAAERSTCTFSYPAVPGSSIGRAPVAISRRS